MHTPLPKRYRFVGTHPKPWKGQIFVLLEVGLCMQDLVGKAFGEVWGSSTMAHTYKINAYYTWGLAGGVSKGNRPKGPKHERRKKRNPPTTSISQETWPKPWGKNMQKGGPPQQTQAHTHTKTNHPKRALRKSKWKKAWHQHRPKQPNTM